MIKFFGGESIWSFSGRGRDVVLKVLFGGIGIAFGCATVLSVWNRDLRRTDCRCGISELGESYCGLESEGLRMSENHLWTAEAGDGSEVAVSNSSESLRLCFADFNRISSLTPSMGLCLFFASCSWLMVYIYDLLIYNGKAFLTMFINEILSCFYPKKKKSKCLSALLINAYLKEYAIVSTYN